MSDIAVPPWMTDPEYVAPCPCGNAPDDDTILIKGPDDLRRWFHEPCLSFLKYELGESELKAIEEWRKDRREAKDPEV